MCISFCNYVTFYDARSRREQEMSDEPVLIDTSIEKTDEGFRIIETYKFDWSKGFLKTNEEGQYEVWMKGDQIEDMELKGIHQDLQETLHILEEYQKEG
jgi:hypothetical protein